MRIFHIATAEDWRAARASGDYTTSTRGRTLEQEGFIHCARREQVARVFARYYADAGEPLVLLGIETDRLISRWQDDPVGDEVYPHVYGPINRGAVVDVQPLDEKGGTLSFTRLFFGEMLFRMLCALIVMALAGIGSVVLAGQGDNGRLLGALGGIVVGAIVWFMLARWRSAASRR